MNLQRIQHLLEQSCKQRLLVIGDVMLDEFVWGKVSRISPEAPVPVVEVQSESSYPGGAANVARNLRPFCKSVQISGVVGRDSHASRLKDLLAEEQIETDGLIETSDMPTIVKTRIIARQQQVVRVDREKRRAVTRAALDAACEQIRSLLPDVDGVIFEDYGKGFLTQAFIDQVSDMAAQAKKILTADPNPGNPLHWKAITTLKPNRSEAFAMAGKADHGAADAPLSDQPLLDTGRHLLEKFRIPSLLITLGEHGIILFDHDHPPYHTPTRAQEVFDVSGAGDTTIALFTLSLCAGATMQEAAEIANHAAGVVVGKLGTATLTPQELLASFETHFG
jgi:D-beta-D-heptose 7-phosphate kinase/D-beta-D-heptose 1-phosphate adenosyltransferase